MILCNKCKEACKGEVLKASGYFFHHSCFVCNVCGCQLVSDGYYEHNGLYFCRADFKKRFSKLCDLCGLTIHGETVSVFEKYFHRHCFICSACKGAFSPGTQVTLWNREFYCSGCFSRRKGVGLASQFGKLKTVCSNKKNGTILSNIRRNLQNSGNEPSIKLLSRAPSDEDNTTNFGRELTERLAVQYNACRKHISDGTTKGEHHGDFQPSVQEKATGSTAGTDEQPLGVEMTTRVTRVGPEDDTRGDAKTEVPVRPDSGTPSAILTSRHLNFTPSTNSFSKRRRRRPYNHTGIQSGRVAELIKFMEELPNKRNSSPNSVASDNAGTPTRHAKPVSAKSSEKVLPEAKGDLCVSMVNDKSSSDGSGVNSQIDRMSQTVVEASHVIERPKQHPRVDGPQMNRSSMSKCNPYHNLEQRWLSCKSTKVTPVQRVWHPVRPTPSLPTTKEMAYRPTPFIETGHLHHSQVKMSCANPQTRKTDHVKPDSSVTVDSVEETSVAVPDRSEEVVIQNKPNVPVPIGNKYDEDKLVSIPAASHFISLKQPPHTDEIPSATDSHDRCASRRNLAIANTHQRKNRRMLLCQRIRGRVYIQGKSNFSGDLLALVSRKRNHKQADGQKSLDPSGNRLRVISLTFGGLVWRLVLAGLCVMVALAILVLLADHKPLIQSSMPDEESPMCPHEAQSLNTGTHKILSTAVRT